MKLLIVSELYHPESDATAVFMTGIAEGVAVAKTAEVSVLCGQPTYHKRGELAPWMEQRRGVRIRRLWSSRCDSRKLPGRLLNLITISLSAFAGALRAIRRGHVVLVVTNPPLLPFVTWIACALKGGRLILLVHDVYPEVFAAVGMLKTGGWPWRLLGWINRRLYRSCEKVVVLGRDMQAIVDRRIGELGHSIVIHNWADVETVEPQNRRDELLYDRLRTCHWPVSQARDELFRRITGKNLRVVLYCGNHGRTHDLETLLQAAEKLRTDPSLLFMFVGEGSAKSRAIALAEKLCLPNTVFTGRVSEHELAAILALGDISVISFKAGMSGVSVPSRMYNAMAAARPILAIADADSELGLVVAEERIGWLCASGDVDGVAETIRAAIADRETARTMGEQARRVACAKYSRDAAIADWLRLIEGMRIQS